MKEQIRRLVRLQEVLFEIRSLEELQKSAPERLAAVEARFEQALGEIGAARLRHEALIKDRQRLNREHEEVTFRLQTLQSKLMQVSNQREYSAALNEIDFSKNQAAQLGEQILITDQQIEELAGPASEADALITQERSKTDLEKAQLASELATVARELGDLIALREQIVKELPRGYFQKFQSIFNARGGIAVAKVERESCSACHVRLRPHLINLVRRSTELIACESCRRILYIGEFGEDGGATPSGDDEGGGARDADPTPPRASFAGA